MADTTVRVSSLVGRGVVDHAGRRHGKVLDVRVVQDGPVGAGGDAAFRVDGLVIGTGRWAEQTGLTRHRVHGPWMLKRLVEILGSSPRFIRWDQLVTVHDDLVEPQRDLHFSGTVHSTPP